MFLIDLTLINISTYDFIYDFSVYHEITLWEDSKRIAHYNVVKNPSYYKHVVLSFLKTEEMFPVYW